MAELSFQEKRLSITYCKRIRQSITPFINLFPDSEYVFLQIQHHLLSL